MENQDETPKKSNPKSQIPPMDWAGALTYHVNELPDHHFPNSSLQFHAQVTVSQSIYTPVPNLFSPSQSLSDGFPAVQFGRLPGQPHGDIDASNRPDYMQSIAYMNITPRLAKLAEEEDEKIRTQLLANWKQRKMLLAARYQLRDLLFAGEAVEDMLFERKKAEVEDFKNWGESAGLNLRGGRTVIEVESGAVVGVASVSEEDKKVEEKQDVEKEDTE